MVAWSMGAGLALELARRHPESIDRLVLVCPATNWREIVQHAAKKAHVPRIFATATMTLMKTPLACRIFGLATLSTSTVSLDSSGSVAVPTVVVHSDGMTRSLLFSRRRSQMHILGLCGLCRLRRRRTDGKRNVDPGSLRDSHHCGAHAHTELSLCALDRHLFPCAE